MRPEGFCSNLFPIRHSRSAKTAAFGLLEKNAHENHPASTQHECHEYLSSNDLQRDFTLRNGVLELKSSPPAI
jgi:hypothetical protein